MTLFFDTETTGRVDFKAPPGSMHQPRMVSLSAILQNDSGNEVGILSFIVDPEITISDEVAAIHGITTEVAQRCGIKEEFALAAFDALLRKADTYVAHNFDFDAFVVSRLSTLRFKQLADHRFCTMAAMTPICKLPGYYGDYKWPKLQEAYFHCFGKEFDGAHSSLADVRATAQIFGWIKDQKARAQL